MTPTIHAIFSASELPAMSRREEVVGLFFIATRAQLRSGGQ